MKSRVLKKDAIIATGFPHVLIHLHFRNFSIRSSFIEDARDDLLLFYWYVRYLFLKLTNLNGLKIQECKKKKKLSNTNKCCSLNFIIIKNSKYYQNKCVPVSTKILRSITVLNIVRNVSCASNKYIRMVSEWSCDTKYWRNDAENLEFSFAFRGINYNLKYSTIENCYLNCNNISQYLCIFYRIKHFSFEQRKSKTKTKKILKIYIWQKKVFL